MKHYMDVDTADLIKRIAPEMWRQIERWFQQEYVDINQTMTLEEMVPGATNPAWTYKIVRYQLTPDGHRFTDPTCTEPMTEIIAVKTINRFPLFVGLGDPRR